MNNHAKRRSVLVVYTGECSPPIQASSRRTRCIARALRDQSWDVVIYIIQFRSRIHKKNCFYEHGVCFRYTSFFFKNRIVSPVLKIAGVIRYLLELLTFSFINKPSVVYIYSSNIISLVAAEMFSLGKVPIVKEVPEWYPLLPWCSSLQKRYWEKRLFNKVDGVVSISNHLTEKVKQHTKKGCLPILNVPILYEDISIKVIEKRNGSLFWCGSVDGFIDLVIFMLHALELSLQKVNHAIELHIYGKYSEASYRKLMAIAKDLSVDKNLVLKGFVDDSTLYNKMSRASVLLLPLFEDERSRFRFPTKLAEYLRCGVPVVATATGELTNYLIDRKSAFLAKPDDLTSFAECIVCAINNQKEAQDIGRAGMILAREHFYYKSHSERVSDFLKKIIK